MTEEDTSYQTQIQNHRGPVKNPLFTGILIFMMKLTLVNDKTYLWFVSDGSKVRPFLPKDSKTLMYLIVHDVRTGLKFNFKDRGPKKKRE